MTEAPVTRREQLRAQTTDEIKEHALAQVAEGGPESLSLNAIARTMRMSGPALYRYFASREDLLVHLAADGYEDLSDAVEAAAGTAERDADEAPAARLRAIAAAYRQWVLDYPHRYRLMFASRYGSGLMSPERILPAAQRTMTVLTAAVAEFGPPEGSALPESLVDQLQAWRASRAGSATLSPEMLHLSVVAWTRLHGIVALEIEGVFRSMGIDPALLYDAEVEEIVTTAAG